MRSRPTEPAGPLAALRGLRLSREAAGEPLPVLTDLDLELRRGETLAVVGPNGSGKSSLLQYLAGDESPVSAPTGLVFQDPDDQLVAATVAEELTLGRPELDVPATLAAWDLQGREGLDPRLLSAGQKQRLQLAVVFAGAPQLLLADEPSSLQDPAQAGWVAERLVRWREETGGTLVWATQRAGEVRRADRALVLAGGRVLALGEPAAVLARPEVANLLEPSYPEDAPPPPGPDPTIVASARGVGCRFAVAGGLTGVDLEVRAGDRLGVTGPNGCGKSTLLAILAGLRRPETGTVRLGERRLYDRGDLDLDHGLAALAPQFPEYLFTRANVAAEVAVDPTLAGRDVAALLQAVGLAPDLAGRDPHDLSGGQKRRLALALALLPGRPLILLDEPTAALDAAGRAAVARLVRCADRRAGVLVASHDTGFLQACGCRVLELSPTGLRSV